MKILITAFVIFMVLLSFALCKVSSTADKDAHEAYEKWKEERRRNEQ